MKKTSVQKLFLLCILSVVLTAGIRMSSAAMEINEEQAAEMNTVENLLSRYQTVTYAQLDYIGGNTTHITFFRDEAGEICLADDENGYEAFRTDALSYARENGKSTYHVSGKNEKEISRYRFIVPGSGFTAETAESGGNIRCEASADIGADYAKDLSSWSVTTKDKMLTSTLFAADDYRVLSIDFTVRHENGEKLKIASGVILYNLDLQYPESVRAYLDAEKAAVTIMLSDGNSRTAKIPIGEPFTWSCDEGYALYTDEEGNTPLNDIAGPVERDMVLYCRPKK